MDGSRLLALRDVSGRLWGLEIANSAGDRTERFSRVNNAGLFHVVGDPKVLGRQRGNKAAPTPDLDAAMRMGAFEETALSIEDVLDAQVLKRVKPGYAPLVITADRNQAQWIEKETGVPVIDALDADNLVTTIGALRRRHSKRKILVVASGDDKSAVIKAVEKAQGELVDTPEMAVEALNQWIVMAREKRRKRERDRGQEQSHGLA